jgi:hypothetical protein
MTLVFLAPLPAAPDVCITGANCIRLAFALQPPSVGLRIISIEVANFETIDFD